MLQGNEKQLEIKSSICGRYCSKTSNMLKRLVNERLTAAAEEIFALFERTIASYEEELSRTKEENEQQRQQLEAVSKTPIVSHTEDVLHEERPPLPQGGSSMLKQKDPKPAHIKEEEDELWITQEGEYYTKLEEDGLPLLPLTVVSVKTEDHEDTPADNLLAPLSDCDDTWSHFPEDADRDNTQEALSSDAGCEGDIRTHTDDKCSKNKTVKKPFSCSVCAKSFSCKAHLHEHMRTHTGEKPFRCSVCGKRCTQKSNMLSHMRTHTEEKPFVCAVCGKSFVQKVSLIAHEEKHTGIKTFVCSVCGKGFSYKTRLKAHMLTHSGENVFSCPVCGKRFSQKADMRSHVRTHTGQQSFDCSVCGRSYSHKKCLTVHMRKHNGE